MQRFTNPRDIYHGKGALEALKTLEGKKAVICVGGGSMKRFGFLDRACAYLQEEGMEFIDVDQKEFADAMIAGVLPTLTDSQRALYDEIAALAE